MFYSSFLFLFGVDNIDISFFLLKESMRVRLAKLPPFCRDCVVKREPICGHSKIAILFSGGLDSAVLAVLADSFVSKDEGIDLLNVAFERCKEPIDPKLGRR